MGKRRDKCKCGKFIIWEDGYRKHDDLVTCKHCGTQYSVEDDDITVFWLEEKVLIKKPYKTAAR